MSRQTPRPRGVARGTTNASTPHLSPSNRKASLHALAGKPTPPAANMSDTDFAVGDLVDVPGDMYGTVKFVGSVHGKQGRFVGVELSREFAARGKNDGDVDGYVCTVPVLYPLHIH